MGAETGTGSREKQGKAGKRSGQEGPLDLRQARAVGAEGIESREAQGVGKTGRMQEKKGKVQYDCNE